MHLRRRIFAAVFATIAVSTVSPARAATTLAPPFEYAWADHSCTGYVMSACRADAAVDADGAIDALLLVGSAFLSPVAPHSGHASAQGLLSKLFTLDREVDALRFTVVVDIERMHAYAGGLLAPASTTMSHRAFVALGASASLAECPQCHGGTEIRVSGPTPVWAPAFGSEPTTIEDERRTLTFEFRDPGNEPLLPGDGVVDVSAILAATAGTYLPDTGSMRAELRARVVSIDVEEI